MLAQKLGRASEPCTWRRRSSRSTQASVCDASPIWAFAGIHPGRRQKAFPAAWLSRPSREMLAYGSLRRAGHADYIAIAHGQPGWSWSIHRQHGHHTARERIDAQPGCRPGERPRWDRYNVSGAPIVLTTLKFELPLALPRARCGRRWWEVTAREATVNSTSASGSIPMSDPLTFQDHDAAVSRSDRFTRRRRSSYWPTGRLASQIGKHWPMQSRRLSRSSRP